MPSAFEYIPPSDSNRNDFNTAVVVERNARRTQYREALRYYLGQHPEQLEYDDDDPNDNTSINLVRMTADRTVSFLFSELPDFLTDPDVIEKNDEEKYMEDALEANGGLNLLHKIGLRGFLGGHNFIRVKPVPEALQGREDVFEKIISLDPTMINVFWRADDVADIVWYEHRYVVGSRVFVQDFVNNQDGTWTIFTYRSVGQQNNIWIDVATHHGRNRTRTVDTIDFESTVFEVVDTEIHTALIPPIVEFPHLPHPDDYYGLGEATQKQLQDTINRIASERNRIVRENSDPIDILLGSDAQEIEGEGGFFSVANAGAKIQRLEMRGDLSGISGTLDKLVETYLSIARVVLLKGDAKDLQRVTNASVRTLFLDSIAKNSVLRQNYGQALSKIGKLLLMMAFARGRVSANPINLKVDVRFSEPLPRDESEVANVNAIGIQGKWMSRRTASSRLALDWTTEKTQLDLEGEEALADQRMQMELMQDFAPDESNSEEEPPENDD